MAGTTYLVFRLTNGNSWSCVDRLEGGRPEDAIQTAAARLRAETNPAREDELLGSWAAVPVTHFHWCALEKTVDYDVKRIELTLPDRQTSLPVGDTDTKEDS